MRFEICAPEDIPLSLLLEADPDEHRILQYLPTASCFVAKHQGDIVGVCLTGKSASGCQEVFNIAIIPEWQAKGIGSQLLRYVLDYLATQSVKRVELGTGTFGHQLSFYQKLGFRVFDVVTDHFLDHYPESLMENGLQHKDMLRLYIRLC